MNEHNGWRAAVVAGAMAAGRWGASAQEATNAPAAHPLEDPMAVIEEAVERIRGSYEQLRTRFDERSRQLRQAQAARQSLEIRRRELESKLDAAIEENDQLRTRNQRLESDLADARQRVVEAQKATSDMEERLASADRDVRRLTRERDDALAALNRERQQRDAVELDLARLKSTMAALERQFKEVPLDRESSAPARPPPGPADDSPPRVEDAPRPPVAPPSEPASPLDPPPITLSVVPIPPPEPSARLLATPSAVDAMSAPAAAPEGSPVGARAPTPVLGAPMPPIAEPAREELTTAAEPAQIPDDAVDELIASAVAEADAGRWRKAVSLCEEALRRRPRDVRAWVTMIQSLQGMGKPEEAWRHAQALLAEAPANLQRLLLAGRSAILARRPAEAVELLKKAADIAPHRADIARELGAAHFDAGQAAQAAEVFRRAVELEPSDGESWFNAAVCLLKSDPSQVAKAAEYYRKAIELGELRDERIEQRLGKHATARP